MNLIRAFMGGGEYNSQLLQLTNRPIASVVRHLFPIEEVAR